MMGVNDTLSGNLYAALVKQEEKAIATFAVGRLLGYEIVLFDGENKVMAVALQPMLRVENGMAKNKEPIYFGDNIQGCISNFGIRVVGLDEFLAKNDLDTPQYVSLGDSVHFDIGALKWEVK